MGVKTNQSNLSRPFVICKQFGINISNTQKAFPSKRLARKDAVRILHREYCRRLKY